MKYTNKEFLFEQNLHSITSLPNEDNWWINLFNVSKGLYET